MKVGKDKSFGGARLAPQTTCADCAGDRKLRRSSYAVATSRAGHRPPRSGRDSANAITMPKAKACWP